MTDLDTIKQQLIFFREERNWRQFHTLKNLIVSLNLEAAELLELTQWKTDDELAAGLHEPAWRQALQDECADVLLYLLLLAHEADIDLLQAAQQKIAKNALRYPVARAYGCASKYTDLPPAAGSGDPDPDR